MVRLAGIQMTAGPALEDNLRAAEAFLHEAARDNAQVAVLPENFALYAGDYRRCAEQHGERLRQWLSDQARSLGLFLVGGTIPLLAREDGSHVPAPRVRSVSLVHGPDGRQLARYDKLHLFDAQVQDAHGRYRESAVFEAGNATRVVDIAGICTGLAVCYDLRFASQARALADEGASLLV
ncbi:MAG: nitrilase-related carbon-nitrogen hydrolase, partial [Alcanivoracaceae bacterium]